MVNIKAEFLALREAETKKGKALIVTFMTGERVFESWLFDEASKKQARAKKKGNEIILTYALSSFNGYLQIGKLLGVE